MGELGRKLAQPMLVLDRSPTHVLSTLCFVVCPERNGIYQSLFYHKYVI